ncbi:branched-chain amino acid ABC transporter substrate-binding protein [bacterium]|nr:branched-chain amino acid ABC transporter substrate-binding protein [bacterium]
MKRVKFLLGISVLVLALGVASLGVMAADKLPVVIGLQAPITGSSAVEGEMAKQSVEIAAQMINEKGGILGGRMIEIMVVDDACQPKESALAATKLVSKGVTAVIQSYGSSVTQPASDIYENYKKVNIAYGATVTGLTERGLKYFFRTCGRTDTQGAFFADEVLPLFNAKKVAIMHDNLSFSLGLAEDTKKALKTKMDAGEVELVYFDAITPGESDYTVPLTKLRETNPDIFYFTGYFPEAGLIIRQARDIGITAVFVGGDAAINEDFINIAGLEYAAGCYQTQEALIEYFTNPEAMAFKEAYMAKYNTLPSSPWSVYAADALCVLAEAIDKSGSTDSDVIADYLRNKMDKFPSITGPVGFNEIGDREGTGINLYVVNADGSFGIYGK